VRQADPLRGDVGRLDLQRLAGDLPKLRPALLSLLRYVKERVSRVRRSADVERLLLDGQTMNLFCEEERRRKGDRARLPDTALGAQRRAGFSEKTLHVTGLDYRWETVRMLLKDLHQGLK